MTVGGGGGGHSRSRIKFGRAVGRENEVGCGSQEPLNP